ncbi:methyl-accepting chemotaxis protein [Halobaculum sp. CBA1158]|uniref:methyl-accepting chemotaxis protein n=1 Tax=Halobaculum sp. CBA1158 TaxID=2904243 RepID=UPI001F1841A7|nr:methyl-accepting chemotaxis protein [Halobaculum sp. CBA1158]UIO98491.1 methyl-accepting chemotaxis protein [Halobaculum sp. CBA1158]
MAPTADGPVSVGHATERVRERFERIVRYTPDGTTIPEERWRGRHRRILISLAAHVPFLLALGLFSGTESLVTGATIPELPTWRVGAQLGVLVAITALATWSRFGRRTRTALASLGLMYSSGVLVQFSGGYIEAHFHFFVVMAVIAVYEDWMPLALGLVYVAGGHVIFSMIDPSTVYNHPAAIANPWAWAGVHAAFILALSAALMTNWYSIEESREESRERLERVTEQKEQVRDAEEAMAEAEARREEVEQLNAHLKTKADDYSTAMSRVADGDLTVRLDDDSESEAMERIAVACNEMLAEIESTVADVKSVSQSVATASEETSEGVDDAERASESVNESVTEIAARADEQRELLDEVAGEMSDLSATVEEIASSAQTVADTSEETAEVADDGREAAGEAIDGMEEVEATIDSTVDNVRSLDEQMDEIGEIVDLIGDIAEQTNMLALNANIEAARAGGSGDGTSDGFAVVADEVKQLAEETREAAADIEELIERTQARTERTVEEVRAAESEIHDGAEAVDEVADALASVADNAAETNQGIQEISRATDDQAASTEEAVAAIEPVADMSEETAADAEAVSETADEQVSTMSRVSAETDSLAAQAERLRRTVQAFEVSGVDGRDDPPANPGDAVALGDGGRPE